MAQIGKSNRVIYNNLQNILTDWYNRSTTKLQALDGQNNVDLDNVMRGLFHRAKETVNIINAHQAIVQNRTGAVASIIAIGEQEWGVGYNVVTEVLNLRTSLQTLKTECRATVLDVLTGLYGSAGNFVGPNDEYVGAGTFSLSDDPNVDIFPPVTPTQYNSLRTTLQTIQASITVE